MHLPRTLLVAATLAGFSSSASASVTNVVNVGPGGNRVFNPSRITNHVGDTIRFVPTGSTHSVSPNGTANETFCGTGNISSPCEVVFLMPGVFGFKCIPHFSLGMTGLVVVLPAGNARPTVSITNPPPGIVFATPTNFVVQASASDSDGTVTQVQFFAGGALVGIDTTTPFSTTAIGLSPGAYSLTARATDNGGLAATSSIVSITINNPPSVALTLPTNGAVLATTLPFTLRATASDNDGTIQQVQFFANTNLLGTSADSGSPFSFRASNLMAGNYSFSARATDNRSALATSMVVNASLVAPSLLRLGTNLMLKNGSFPLTLSVTPGLTYSIEGSTNRPNWSNVVTFIANSNSYNYSNPLPAGSLRHFYRGRLLPNP